MVGRQALQRVLCDAAVRIPMRLGVESIEVDEGHATVGFSDGARERYALVVGSDGVRSRVRALHFGPIRPEYVGQIYWRTTAPVELVDCATMMVEVDCYVVFVPLGGGVSHLAWPLKTAEPFGDPVEGRLARLRARFGDFAEPGLAALASLCDDGSVQFGAAEELARAPDRESALAAFVARRRARVDWVRRRTQVEIDRLNRGGSHFDERSSTAEEVLGNSI